jgi:hypothetical protein
LRDSSADLGTSSKDEERTSILAQTHIASFAGRVGFVFVAGILAAIATNVSYWNWYGFPSVYIGSYMLIQVVGFSVVGIVAALVLRKHAVVA